MDNITYNEIYNYVANQLATNDFLVGAGASVIFFALIKYVSVVYKTITRAVNYLVSKYLITTIILNGKDDIYPYFIQWLKDQQILNHNYTREIRTKEIYQLDIDSTTDTSTSYHYDMTATQRDSDPSVLSVQILPFSGDYLVKFKSMYLYVTRNIKSPFSSGGGGGSDSDIEGSVSNSSSSFRNISIEQLQIKLLKRNVHKLSSVFEEVSKVLIHSNQRRNSVYTMSYGSWQNQFNTNKRRLNTIHLKEGQADAILADLTKFKSEESWYTNRGIPYHRGYLLHGNPGTGKSSVLHAIVSELNMDVYVLSLSSVTSDSELLQYMLSVKPNSALLLEDVDACGITRDNQESNISFSTLLNAIDGITAKHGNIIFMTTNYIDKLDPALLRPGRVDYKMHFSNCDDYQIRKFAECFYIGLSDNQYDFIVEYFSSKNISPAKLQDLCIKHRTYKEIHSYIETNIIDDILR